jgi:hypothetical protein
MEAAGPFVAGVAAREVTPEPGLEMAGYSAREGVSAGVRDPLRAKAVVLGDGSKRVALVQLDWIGPPGLELVEEIKQAVKARSQVDSVLIIATHSHSGPSTPRAATDDVLRSLPHVQRMMTGLIEAIVEASNNAVPAKIAIGRGACHIAHNRRAIRPDGSVHMLWANMDRVPTTPVDPEVGVIRLAAASDDAVIATLVCFACHPVVFGPDHMNYSADFVGEATQAVEGEQGGMCIYLQGAAGDLNPYADKRLQEQRAEHWVRAAGIELADEVNRVSRTLQPAVPKETSLKIHTRTMMIKPRYDFEDPETVRRLGKILSPGGLKRYQTIFKRYADGFLAPMSAVILNGDLAFATFPGEFFVEFQQQLKSRSPVADTFFLGYCNASYGYFPTVQAASEGGYGATTNSFVEIGAGERMVLQALIDLHQLSGRFDNPQP